MYHLPAQSSNGIPTVNEDWLLIFTNNNNLSATVKMQMACSVRQVQCNKEASRKK
jgi:hypothetical protein